MGSSTPFKGQNFFDSPRVCPRTPAGKTPLLLIPPGDFGKALVPRKLGLNQEKTRTGTSDHMISSGIAEGEWGTGTLSSGRLRICSKDTRICSDSSTLRCSGGSSSQNRLWALAEEELVGKPFCVYYIPTPCFVTHYKAGEELRHMHNFSVSRHRPKGDTYVVPCVESKCLQTTG